MGIAAAEAMQKSPGDSLQLGSSLFRIVGIYQTGDAFEDRGMIIRLEDAQTQFDRPGKVIPGGDDISMRRLAAQCPDRRCRAADDRGGQDRAETVADAAGHT